MATTSTGAPTNAEIVRLLEALRSELSELKRSLAARQS
jgi:hypothetical protein